METLSMGGYGAYVWTSYALTLAVIVLCTVQSRRRHRRVLQDIRIRLEAAESGK